MLGRSRSFGFLGPGALGPQVLHALGFADAVSAVAARTGDPDLAAPDAVLDLGSGGGLPGLVLAERWPAAALVLLDANERRTSFLAAEVERLGWGPRVIVVRARAEEAGRRLELRGAFDVVVARSFGPPPVTAECGSPFLRVGGLLVVSEPPVDGEGGARGEGGSAGDGIARPGDGEAVAGAGAAGARWEPDGLAEVGLEVLGTFAAGPYGYQVLRQVVSCPDRYPRRVGIPVKRPIYRVQDTG